MLYSSVRSLYLCAFASNKSCLTDFVGMFRGFFVTCRIFSKKKVNCQ